VFILQSRKSFRLFWLVLCGALIAAAGVTGVTLSNSFILVAAGIGALFLIIALLSIFSVEQDEFTGMSLLPEWKPKQDTTH
jgi:hypothetical protein